MALNQLFSVGLCALLVYVLCASAGRSPVVQDHQVHVGPGAATRSGPTEPQMVQNPGPMHRAQGLPDGPQSRISTQLHAGSPAEHIANYEAYEAARSAHVKAQREQLHASKGADHKASLERGEAAMARATLTSRRAAERRAATNKRLMDGWETRQYWISKMAEVTNRAQPKRDTWPRPAGSPEPTGRRDDGSYLYGRASAPKSRFAPSTDVKMSWRDWKGRVPEH